MKSTLYFRSASLNKKFVILTLVLCFMGTFFMNDAYADGPIGVKVFGGSVIDQFDNISATQDGGFITVGRIDSVRIVKLGADGSTRWDVSPSALLFLFRDRNTRWKLHCGRSIHIVWWGNVWHIQRRSE